jgi:hypothetical protein
MRVKGSTTDTPTLADAIRAGDQQVIASIASFPLIPRNDNFMARPWAGQRLCAYKGLGATSKQRWGEAFEVAAFADDEEARAHPSCIQLVDGSEIGLPELLTVAGLEILGKDFVNLHGRQLPLLPKILDVGVLQSVQAHPEGFTEVYVIIEAEEGATLRLGFKHDVDRAKLGDCLEGGQLLQNRLLKRLGGNVDVEALQAALASNFSRRDVSAETALSTLNLRLRNDDVGKIAETLRELKSLYWEVLDLLNEVPATPGQVIYNANSEDVFAASGRARSAEVHALGNPEGRDILALEIRRPGPTYRAWDHARFPLRDIDVGKTMDALNPRATRAADFIVTPRELADFPRVFRSVQDDWFVVDHLRPLPGITVAVPAESKVHTLHAIRGTVTLLSGNNETLGVLTRGQSALVPVNIGNYRMTTVDDDAEVVMVTIRTTTLG